jgi:ferrochelatase
VAHEHKRSNSDTENLGDRRKENKTSPGAHMTNKPAVVLANLGTPQAPTTRAVRRYLREFLSDRRVVETHPLLWRPILEGIILRVRPKASAHKYATVWQKEGSPLMVGSLAQRDALASHYSDQADIYTAMRYGQPALQSVLTQIQHKGHDRMLVVPLYPQYAACCAGTVMDEVHRWGLAARNQLELRTIRSFPTDPRYIEALAVALLDHWDRNGRPQFERGDRVLLSFHGIPVAMHTAGDPYRSECEATLQALGERLEIPVIDALSREGGGIAMTFQSVFGPAEWLTPATIDTVAALGAGTARRVDVICPGFVSDCLETLEEIDMLNRDAFMNAGGEEFHYVPWGNGNDAWTKALAEIVGEHLAGWV